MLAILTDGDRREALRRLQVPTLVLHGDADPLVPFAAGKDTADNVPGARLVTIPGMGHELPEGAWPQMIDEIAQLAGSAERASAVGSVLNRTILVVFALVYLGMILGRLPRLQLDRTGIALLGTLVLLAVGAVSLDSGQGRDRHATLALLFAFMVLSAQLRLGGFYTRVVRAVTARDLAPEGLLAAILVTAALLSAVFTNDVVLSRGRAAGDRGVRAAARLGAGALPARRRVRLERRARRRR